MKYLAFCGEKAGDYRKCLKNSVTISADEIYKIPSLEGSGMPVIYG